MKCATFTEYALTFISETFNVHTRCIITPIFRKFICIHSSTVDIRDDYKYSQYEHQHHQKKFNR